MKAKIKEIWQPKNENILEIEYESGARRFSELDDWGDYQLTKTQRDFMERAKVTETETRNFLEVMSMTRFYLNDLEKWMAQNKAQYTGDYIEGNLLDNFVLETKRGFAAVYEHPATEWSSNYYVEFEPKAAQNVWHNWYEFEEKARVAE